MPKEEMEDVFVSITVPAGTGQQEAARRASALLKSRGHESGAFCGDGETYPAKEGKESFCGNLELPLALYEDVEAGAGFFKAEEDGVLVEFECP